MSEKRIAAGSLALFVLSLALPAIRQVSVLSPHDLSPANITGGLYLLALGWTGVLAGIFAWLANPCYVLGMFFYLARGQGLARLLTLLAVVLALTTLIHVQVPFQSDAGGSGRSLLVLMPGFYVWIASFAFAAVGAWLPTPAPASSEAAG